MSIITIDFETYYDASYSLSKLSTEEYIRNPLFEVIGVGVKVDDAETEWASGTHEQLAEYLAEFDFENSMLLAHNTMFDGAILNWVFGITCKGYLDTLSMAQALVTGSRSLANLAKRYGLGEKGTEIVNAKGKRRRDFMDEELSKYGDYCINDVELTYRLLNAFMAEGFPQNELKVVDATLRMFIEPVLELDPELLSTHLKQLQDEKKRILATVPCSRDELMSNPKFAEVLLANGVTPPKKISPRTGEPTYAFAKSDPEFVALQEHDDPNVQALVAARLGTKSTLAETRTQRLLDISSRGNFPVPIKYCAAHTHRWGGADKVNIQNLPSRGKDSKTKALKNSIMAPAGYTLIDCDASQIEARVLAWFAGQQDLVAAFKNGDPIYEEMAAEIYGLSVEEVMSFGKTTDHRHVGKTAVLGCGYGMGAPRFQIQLANDGVEMDFEDCKTVIRLYRYKYRAIKDLWSDASDMLGAMVRNDDEFYLGPDGAIVIDCQNNSITLPSGLKITYRDLKYEGGEYSYAGRYGRTKIYGGKVVENIIQSLARDIIAEHIVKIRKKYRVVLTVHDSVVSCVKKEELDEARDFIEATMRVPPVWGQEIPLDCESGVGRRYGEC